MGITLKSYEYDLKLALSKRGLETNGKVQKFIDSEVLRKNEPLIPYANGDIVKSGINNTIQGSGEIKYQTPYARRWYYMPAEYQDAPMRGNYWFERMKNEGGKDEILKSTIRMAGAR